MAGAQERSFRSYHTLQVDADADDEAIHMAYSRPAMPGSNDKQGTPVCDGLSKSQQIEQAYKAVSNPDSRREYDAAVLAQWHSLEAEGARLRRDVAKIEQLYMARARRHYLSRNRLLEAAKSARRKREHSFRQRHSVLPPATSDYATLLVFCERNLITEDKGDITKICMANAEVVRAEASKGEARQILRAVHISHARARISLAAHAVRTAEIQRERNEKCEAAASTGVGLGPWEAAGQRGESDTDGHPKALAPEKEKEKENEAKAGQLVAEMLSLCLEGDGAEEQCTQSDKGLTAAVRVD